MKKQRFCGCGRSVPIYRDADIFVLAFAIALIAGCAAANFARAFFEKAVFDLIYKFTRDRTVSLIGSSNPLSPTTSEELAKLIVQEILANKTINCKEEEVEELGGKKSYIKCEKRLSDFAQTEVNNYIAIMKQTRVYCLKKITTDDLKSKPNWETITTDSLFSEGCKIADCMSTNGYSNEINVIRKEYNPCI